MQVGLRLAGLLLRICARCEVASPVILRLISVREHIVVAHGPLNLFIFLERVDVLGRRRVEQGDVIVLGVKVFDSVV